MAEEELSPVPPAVPVVVVPDVRVAIVRASAMVYGDPTRSLSVVGIAGTNGKTTTSYLTLRALEANGKRPGLIGTIGYRFEDWAEDAPHTTPESDEIDDPFGRDLARRVRGPLVRVSSIVGAAADIASSSVEFGSRATKAALLTPQGPVELDSKLIGGHNLSNMVVCLGISSALGLDLAKAASALSEVSVPGRLELEREGIPKPIRISRRRTG